MTEVAGEPADWSVDTTEIEPVFNRILERTKKYDIPLRLAMFSGKRGDRHAGKFILSGPKSKRSTAVSTFLACRFFPMLTDPLPTSVLDAPFPTIWSATKKYMASEKLDENWEAEEQEALTADLNLLLDFAKTHNLPYLAICPLSSDGDKTTTMYQFYVSEDQLLFNRMPVQMQIMHLFFMGIGVGPKEKLLSPIAEVMQLLLATAPLVAVLGLCEEMAITSRVQKGCTPPVENEIEEKDPNAPSMN